MKDSSLARIGGFAGIAVAALSIVYAVAYLFITPAAQRGTDAATFYASFAANPTGWQLANLCFGLSGIAGPFVVAAVAQRLRGLSQGWAGWALVVGSIATLATGVHGFWNMARTPLMASLYNSGDPAIRAALAVMRTGPVPADPVEFFTFGITGLWALVVGLLILRGADLPRRLGYVALAAGIAMLLLFVGDITASQVLILGAGGLASLILGPAMWAGIGLALLRGAEVPTMASAGVSAGRA